MSTTLTNAQIFISCTHANYYSYYCLTHMWSRLVTVNMFIVRCYIDEYLLMFITNDSTQSVQCAWLAKSDYVQLLFTVSGCC